MWFISKITHISKPSENVMKFVTLNICSLLNISLKYMKQLPLIVTTIREHFFFFEKQFDPTTLVTVFHLGFEKDRVHLADGGHFYA